MRRYVMSQVMMAGAAQVSTRLRFSLTTDRLSKRTLEHLFTGESFGDDVFWYGLSTHERRLPKDLTIHDF